MCHPAYTSIGRGLAWSEHQHPGKRKTGNQRAPRCCTSLRTSHGGQNRTAHDEYHLPGGHVLTNRIPKATVGPLSVLNRWYLVRFESPNISDLDLTLWASAVAIQSGAVEFVDDDAQHDRVIV